jgi:uncharacterized protein (TIGR00252 family)
MPSSTEVGRAAETCAADFLIARGYKIVDQNWRTRWCEVDIIAAKNNCVYFAEVKYRRTSLQGSGLDYITPKKLRQMQFAAQYWAAGHMCEDYNLAAVAVTGEPPQVTDFIDVIE